MPAFSPENLVDRTIRVVDLLGLVRVDYEIRRLRSLKSAMISMGHLAAALGDWPAADVETDFLNDYVLARRRQGAAEASIKMEIGFLRRGYRLAVRQKRIHHSIVPEFPLIGADKLTVRRGFLSEDDVRRVRLHLEPDVSDLIGFLFASAWRFGEATALVWPWVDGDAIRLPTTKNGRPRTLVLAGEIAELIERRRERELGEYVFHRRGNQIKTIAYQWRHACQRAGLEGRLVHDLRRSAIKRMMENGANQGDAMSISGHLTTATFHRYQIIDGRRQREILEGLAKRPPARGSAERPTPPRLKDWGS